MMPITFTKLFSSITESTVWCESSEVRLTWITMLAMADKQGRVFASIPGLANRARVPVEAVEDAISKFLGPDTYSRTKEHEGRRIEEIDGGWRLLNHAKYRALRDEESRRESKREWARGSRQKRLQSATVGRDRPIADTDPEADPDTSTTTTLPGKPGATAKPPAAAKRMAGPEGEILRAFDKGHREAFAGAPYMAAFARDSKVIKDALKVYGLPRVLDFVEAFWRETEKARANPDDPTYAAGKAKPTIPGLVGQIPNLLRRYHFDSAPVNGGDHERQ